MKLLAFSIYDSKAEAYIIPFFAPTTGIAIRNFATAAMDPNHQFHIHAGDYTLFEIGEFDQQTGQLTKRDAFVNLGLALAVQATSERHHAE